MTFVWCARRERARRAGLLLAFGVCCAVPAPPASAVTSPQGAEALANLSLADLMRVRVEPVFGAAGRRQPVTEAPSAVTIVTAEDIARYGYRSLADILRGVRGLYVTYDRNYSYLGTRGFARPGDYNTRLLLLVDGHRLNDDVFDQAGIGPELGLDPETFDRVEIIRGPSSALYGANAFFAVVSITTKHGIAARGLRATGEVGSLGTERAYVAGGMTGTGGLEAAFSAHLTTSDGARRLFYPVYDAPESHSGVVEGIDEEASRGLTGRFSVGRLTVTSAYGWRRKQVPTAAFDTLFGDPRFVTFDKRDYVDATYTQPFLGATVSLRGYADRYLYDGTYPYAPLTGEGPAVMFTDYGHGTWWGSEGRVTRPLPHRQTLVAGLEFRDYLQQDQGAAYEDNRVPAFATKVGTHVVALYAQDEWRTRDWLLLSVGSRFDTYGSVSHFSPRASVVWMPKPTRSVKYLFGSAFRAPNAYELDYLTNGVRNQTLGVETIQSHEVVWEEYLRGRLRTSVSAYWNAADHLITLVGDDPEALSYVNDGRLRARGIEGEVEIRLRSGVEALGSYAYGRASDASGMNLTNAPRHLAKLRVSGNGPVRGSTLAFELQAMSDRLTIMQERAPGFAVANLTYRQPLAGGAGLSFSIRNLFDAAYADPASEEHLEDVIPQDGRTFRFGLEWGWTPR